MWYFPTSIFRQKYTPCSILNIDYIFYAKLYDSIKEGKIYFLNFLSSWLNEQLMKFTFEKSKTRKYSFLKCNYHFAYNFSNWKTKCVFRTQKYFTIMIFLVSKQYHSCYFLCIHVPLTIDLKLISFKFSFTCALKPEVAI